MKHLISPEPLSKQLHQILGNFLEIGVFSLGTYQLWQDLLMLLFLYFSLSESMGKDFTLQKLI